MIAILLGTKSDFFAPWCDDLFSCWPNTGPLENHLIRGGLVRSWSAAFLARIIGAIFHIPFQNMSMVAGQDNHSIGLSSRIKNLSQRNNGFCGPALFELATFGQVVIHGIDDHANDPTVGSSNIRPHIRGKSSASGVGQFCFVIEDRGEIGTSG